MTRLRETILSHAVLATASAISLLPIVGVLLLSLQPNQNFGNSMSPRSAWHISNYGAVWEKADFGGSFRTSIAIAVSTVVIAVVLSVLAGYAFALIPFPGSSWLFYGMLFGILVPIESMIVPLYFDLRSWGITNGYASIILPECAFNIAFGTFWMRAYFMSAARSIIEAARMDGANSLKTLVHILLPLARPQILSLSVLLFVWTWNDFLLPLVMLSGSSLRTVTMSLVLFQGAHTTNYTYLAAGSLITVFPVLLVYVLMQRSFTSDMLAGSIKQ